MDSTGDADRATAGDLGELTHDLTHCAGRSRHHHRLPGLRLSDVVETEIGRHPRHAEDAVGGGDRRQRRVDLAHGGAGADGILLPAETVLDDIADLEAGMVRFHHLADGAARHDLADADGRRVGGGVAHAAAHVGIERHVDHAHQHLARARLGHGHLLDAEIGFGHFRGRAARENDAAMGFGDHARSPAA